MTTIDVPPGVLSAVDDDLDAAARELEALVRIWSIKPVPSTCRGGERRPPTSSPG